MYTPQDIACSHWNKSHADDVYNRHISFEWSGSHDHCVPEQLDSLPSQPNNGDGFQ